MIDIACFSFGILGFLVNATISRLVVSMITVHDRVAVLWRIQLFIALLLATSLSMLVFLGLVRVETFFILLILSQVVFHGGSVLYVLLFTFFSSSSLVRVLYGGVSKKVILSEVIDRMTEQGVLDKNGFYYEAGHRFDHVSLVTTVDRLMMRIFPHYE